MSKQSRIPGSISPLLWLAPLPFALAMCLPLDLSRSTPAPAEYDRVATAAQQAQQPHRAASAVDLPH